MLTFRNEICQETLSKVYTPRSALTPTRVIEILISELLKSFTHFATVVSRIRVTLRLAYYCTSRSYEIVHFSTTQDYYWRLIISQNNCETIFRLKLYILSCDIDCYNKHKLQLYFSRYRHFAFYCIKFDL